MSAILSRRALLAGAACLPFAPAFATGQSSKSAQQQAGEKFAAIEARTGGRLGIAVLDTATSRRLMHRADERFPLASTFKVLVAAAVLQKADADTTRLDRLVRFEQADVLKYSPVTRDHVADGMTLEALCAAAVVTSDNTAGNLLLREIGGPPGLTRYTRTLGDDVTRLDRTEPTLNTAIARDARDTTSPNGMLISMNAILLGKALKASSRDRLEGWMAASKTGLRRLRAGVPPDWMVADKTGTGNNGTANVVAILRPPGRAPILAAVYLTGATASAEARDAAHAQIGRIIAEVL